MSTSRDKLQQARELIQAKRYDEARVILRSVDAPQATEWLAKLDSISPVKAQSDLKNKNNLGVIIGVGVVISLIAGLVVGFFAGYNYRQREIESAFANVFGGNSAVVVPTLDAPSAMTFVAATNVVVGTAIQSTMQARIPSTAAVSPTVIPAATTSNVGNSDLPPTWTPTSVDQSISTGKWQLDNSTSALNDTTTTVLRLVANGDEDSIVDQRTLILRCKDKVANAYVKTDKILKDDIDSHETPLAIRFDNQPAQKLTGDTSTGGDAVFFKDPSEMIKSLSKANRFVLGYTPYNAGMREVIFDVQGLKAAIQASQQNCGWQFLVR